MDRTLLSGVYLLASVVLRGRGARPSEFQVVVVQSFSRVWLLATPWTAAPQASLPFPISQSLFAQTHVHWVSDAIQPSHPLSPPSPAFSLSQHKGLFLRVSSSHHVAKVLELQRHFSSVAQSCPTLCDPVDCSTQASLSFTVSWICSNSCPSSRRCHPTISSSVTPFSFCPQAFPASGSFLMSRLFGSGG